MTERKPLTQQEKDRWLLACMADPSVVTPHEMGYKPDWTRRFPDAPTERASTWFQQHADPT